MSLLDINTELANKHNWYKFIKRFIYQLQIDRLSIDEKEKKEYSKWVGFGLIIGVAIGYGFGLIVSPPLCSDIWGRRSRCWYCNRINYRTYKK